MRKMTTQEYILEKGVTETVIMGRPKFPNKIQKEFQALKESISGLEPFVKLSIMDKFSMKNAKKLLGFYYYRVDLLEKDIIEEIFVPLKDVSNFNKKHMTDSVVFMDLHFDNGKKTNKGFFTKGD